jgi:hypothetical protein
MFEISIKISFLLCSVYPKRPISRRTKFSLIRESRSNFRPKNQKQEASTVLVVQNKRMPFPNYAQQKLQEAEHFSKFSGNHSILVHSPA